MDKWSHMDLGNLLEQILSGEHNIQEPIVIHNIAGDHVNKQSFINYLMNYENINKDNFLKTLHDMFKTLQSRIYKLQENPNINSIIIRVNDEWMKPGREFKLMEEVPDDLFQIKELLENEYGNSCSACNNVEQTCQVLRSSPLDDIQETNRVDRETNWAIMLCDELTSKFQKTMDDVQSMISQLETYDLSLLIDLSIKHKSFYLKLNGTQDDQIPDNIHTIFSNYIYMFNLFHKQLVQYYHTLELLLQDLQDRCSKMKSIQGNFGMVAQVDLKKLLGQEKKEIKQIEDKVAAPTIVEELSDVSSEDDSDDSSSESDEDPDDQIEEEQVAVPPVNKEEQSEGGGFFSFF